MSDREYDYAEDLYDRSQEAMPTEWEDARKFGLGHGRFNDEHTIESMVNDIISFFEEQEGLPEAHMDRVRDYLWEMVEDDLGDEPADGGPGFRDERAEDL